MIFAESLFEQSELDEEKIIMHDLVWYSQFLLFHIFTPFDILALDYNKVC